MTGVEDYGQRREEKMQQFRRVRFVNMVFQFGLQIREKWGSRGRVGAMGKTRSIAGFRRKECELRLHCVIKCLYEFW